MIVGTARISADERSNQVLIITRPENMPFLRRIVAELDSPSTASIAHRRPLNFVSASNILQAIVDALSPIPTKSANTSQRPQNQTQTQPQHQSQPTASTSSSGDLSSSSLSATPLVAPEQNDIPSVVAVGQTKIMADDRSNSIIVFGSPDNVKYRR